VTEVDIVGTAPRAVRGAFGERALLCKLPLH